MNAVLVMTKANGERRAFPVEEDKVIIGRKIDCTLRIPLAAVSREHCHVEIRDGELYLRDLGSANGTYHNQVRIQETKLAAGDKITIGPVNFTVVIDGVGDEDASDAPAKQTSDGSTMEMAALDQPIASEAADPDDSDIIELNLDEDASSGTGAIQIEGDTDDEPSDEDEFAALIGDDDDDDDFGALIGSDDDDDDDDGLDDFDFLLEDDEEDK